ncbi:MAG: lipocalin family protein [Ferruginibacter sp.]
MKYLILLFAFFLFSCADTKNNQMIIGHWKAASWFVDGKPADHNIAATSFSFDDKGNYSFNYAGTEEKGSYKVENDMLFTHPSGQNEIMVKIAKLTADSLVFEMNRGGTAEVLTLLRNK